VAGPATPRGELGPVEIETVVHAPAAAVWAALADPDRRGTWWPYLDLDARPGGRLLER